MRVHVSRSHIQSLRSHPPLSYWKKEVTISVHNGIYHMVFTYAEYSCLLNVPLLILELPIPSGILPAIFTVQNKKFYHEAKCVLSITLQQSRGFSFSNI